jgi:hypothetical protein
LDHSLSKWGENGRWAREIEKRCEKHIIGTEGIKEHGISR